MSMFSGWLDKRAMSNLNAAGAGFNKAFGDASVMGQGKAALGNMLNKTIGGGLLGAAGNAAVYASTGQGVNGSYSYGEAIMGGLTYGAAAGAVLGAVGARAAARGVTRSLGGKTKRLDAAEAVARKRGLLEGGVSSIKTSQKPIVQAKRRAKKANLTQSMNDLSDFHAQRSMKVEERRVRQQGLMPASKSRRYSGDTLNIPRDERFTETGAKINVQGPASGGVFGTKMKSGNIAPPAQQPVIGPTKKIPKRKT